VLAMIMALLLALAGPAMAGCQAKGAATTQEGGTTNRGATNASAVGGPQVVIALRAWGNNYDGQLGDGTNGNKRTRPVEVVGLRRAKIEDIAAGSTRTLALKDDGSVWAWGPSEQGQLGNGTKTEGTKTLGINTPLKVKDLGGVELIATGVDFSFAGSK
jgi:alpha-tubulin suppressor-like RCC1 family protein